LVRSSEDALGLSFEVIQGSPTPVISPDCSSSLVPLVALPRARFRTPIPAAISCALRGLPVPTLRPVAAVASQPDLSTRARLIKPHGGSGPPLGSRAAFDHSKLGTTFVLTAFMIWARSSYFGVHFTSIRSQPGNPPGPGAGFSTTSMECIRSGAIQLPLPHVPGCMGAVRLGMSRTLPSGVW
jgi:hypothetical protein